MARDKKARGNTIRFVVITDIGVTDRVRDVAQGELIKAYEKVCT